MLVPTGSAGSFTKRTVTTSLSSCQGAVVGDINNDGLNDLIVGCTSLVYFLGDGAGNFGSQVTVAAGDANSFLPALGDIDGDGWLDITATDGSITNLFINNKDGTFTKTRRWDTPFTARSQLVADFTGDSRLDILLSADQGLFLVSGSGSFPIMSFPATALSGSASGDFNKDGRLDAVVASQPLGATLYRNYGCKGFLTY